MKVIIKDFDGRPYEAEIENKLEAMQKIVGGYIEVIPLTFDDVIVCNEDGKLKDLPHNFNMPVHGSIVGTVIICSEEGEGFTDFTDVKCTVEEFEQILRDWGNEAW